MRRILIAEDDNISREFMKELLSQYGECDIAVDGIEAVDAFIKAWDEEKPYDLICLDVMMPKLDGIKVLKTIRKIENEKGTDMANKVKVIMMTALNDRKTVVESYDSGCEAYTWKPIDIKNFKTLLYRLGFEDENIGA